jgi:hypothetical protein
MCLFGHRCARRSVTPPVLCVLAPALPLPLLAHSGSYWQRPERRRCYVLSHPRICPLVFSRTDRHPAGLLSHPLPAPQPVSGLNSAACLRQCICVFCAHQIVTAGSLLVVEHDDIFPMWHAAIAIAQTDAFVYDLSNNRLTEWQTRLTYGFLYEVRHECMGYCLLALFAVLSLFWALWLAVAAALCVCAPFCALGTCALAVRHT